MKVYIYVTKAKPYLFYQSFIWKKDFGKYVTSMTKPDEIDEEPILNGKIAASFDLDVAEYIPNCSSGLFLTSRTNQGETLEKSCLKYDELKSYLKKGHGYAWLIENLIVLKYPVPINDFVGSEIRDNPKSTDVHSITKSPQSWCYVVGRNAIIISIKSKWACKILNGEKTIEIRKTCPKGVHVEGGR